MTDDDRRLACELDEFITDNYASASDFLKEAALNTGWKGSEPTLSKIRHGKRKMPEPLRRWFTIEVSFGAVYIEEDKGGSKLLRLLRRAMEEKDYEVLIHSATEFIAAYSAGCMRSEGPEFLPRLYAYRAVGYRGMGCVAETIRDYRTAAELARVSAPRLCPRYEISTIVWESESVNDSYKSRKVSKTYWEQRLGGMVGQLTTITTGCDKDENLRLQSLLRNTSRLDKRTLFDHWLGEARKHPGFGATPEKCDAYLRRWMSEKKDKDGDFKNARSYQTFTDLFNV
jgi:hypothetical protein